VAIYSEEMIQEVINSNDIVDVVSEYVQLKRAGRNYTGLCPFHREKTPSFVVSPDKQIYHCFGCGKGGNVLSFVMDIENLEFVDALQHLANRAGMELKAVDTGYIDRNKDLRERLYSINLEAANYWYTNLYKPTGKVALDYLYNRKLDDNTIKKFGLGYCNNATEMYNYLKSKGFTEEEILKSSLVEKKDTRYVDKFRDRLMFPIIDVRGRIIAFGGRVLNDSKPKYINSPESIIYSKARNLFGLNIAKKEKLDRILIVEGYMDTISLHQRKIPYVVASLGTALTEEQAKLLRKYSSNVVIGYDADGAGQAATLRGLDILTKAGCEVKVLQLDKDDVKDPDEYIIKYGSGRFENLVENAITLVEFKLQLLLKKYDINKIDEKIKFLNEMAVVLASITNEIERDVYVDNISKTTGIGKDPIYAEINKLKLKFTTDLKNVTDNRVLLNQKTIKKDETVIEKTEKYIIYLLLENNSDIYNQIKEKISLDYIQTEKFRNIIKKLFDYYETNNKVKDIVTIFSEEEDINIISSTICLDYNTKGVEKIVNDIYKTLKKNKLEKQKYEILNKLKEENTENKQELELELSKILIDLNKF